MEIEINRLMFWKSNHFLAAFCLPKFNFCRNSIFRQNSDFLGCYMVDSSLLYFNECGGQNLPNLELDEVQAVCFTGTQLGKFTLC